MEIARTVSPLSLNVGLNRESARVAYDPRLGKVRTVSATHKSVIGASRNTVMAIAVIRWGPGEAVVTSKSADGCPAGGRGATDVRATMSMRLSPS
jgi:hypothetical protein